MAVRDRTVSIKLDNNLQSTLTVVFCLTFCFRSSYCTTRLSGAMAAFLGKVGHSLIMKLHHLTINYESNLGTAQQKQTKRLLSRAWLQMPLPHSFIEYSAASLVSFPFFAHWRQHWTGILMPRRVHVRWSAAGANSAECISIKSQ